jgi:hypothetical protein
MTEKKYPNLNLPTGTYEIKLPSQWCTFDQKLLEGLIMPVKLSLLNRIEVKFLKWLLRIKW